MSLQSSVQIGADGTGLCILQNDDTIKAYQIETLSVRCPGDPGAKAAIHDGFPNESNVLTATIAGINDTAEGPYGLGPGQPLFVKFSDCMPGETADCWVTGRYVLQSETTLRGSLSFETQLQKVSGAVDATIIGQPIATNVTDIVGQIGITNSPGIQEYVDSFMEYGNLSIGTGLGTVTTTVLSSVPSGFVLFITWVSLWWNQTSIAATDFMGVRLFSGGSSAYVGQSRANNPTTMNPGVGSGFYIQPGWGMEVVSSIASGGYQIRWFMSGRWFRYSSVAPV